MTDQTNKPSRGIIILALKSPYYIRMAYNLAISLRQKQNGHVNILLVTQEHVWKDLGFNQQWQFPKKKFLTDAEAQNPFLTKLMLYDLSPFDETLYIDADTLWLPNKTVPSLFDELKEAEFAVANRGYLTAKSDYDWANMPDFIATTGKEKVIDVASEVIYFKKTEKVKELFEEATTFYLTNKIVNKFIGGHQPDEPAITYAIEKTELLPHKTPFLPSYWHRHNHQPPRRKEDMYNNYYLLSMGGSAVRDDIRKLYNGLLKHYANQLGASFYYPHENKNIRQFNLNRAVI